MNKIEWNVELTEDEIALIYSGVPPLPVRPQNLVAYWPLIRDDGQDRISEDIEIGEVD